MADAGEVMDFVGNVEQELSDGVNIEIFEQQCALRSAAAQELNGCLQALVFCGRLGGWLWSGVGHLVAEQGIC
ncbi:MAG: hypothetical protein ACKPJJ_25420 [Planctomycetaceae bacterium]